MSEATENVYASLAPLYRARGYWPRRVTPGSKACYDPAWQKPDPEQPPERLKEWVEAGSSFGIGLLMGSPFPDGSRLGAFDIDNDDYVRLGRALLGHPPCGRIGKKGAVFFVRTLGRETKDMDIVIGSGTPSDHRSMKNFLAQLKRSGFIWPWPPNG